MCITTNSGARLLAHMRLLLVAGLLAVLSLGGAQAANARDASDDTVPLPGALAQDAAGWRSLGSGNLRWFGMDIYRASLWAPDDGRLSLESSFALAIRYERGISSQRLVETTLNEMQRLGTADDASRSAWRSSLEQAFPSVLAGEVIVGVNRPGFGVAFFHQGRLTAAIDDAGFAQAFFAIWLDERTREPGLRASLLGERSPRSDG